MTLEIVKSSEFDYPDGAADVRDLIRRLLASEVDAGSSMDGGGGLGSADLWAKLGGREYFISVTPTKPAE